MKQISIYPIGTKVLVNDHIDGHITRISLTTAEHIPVYEVEWFDGSTPQPRWLYSFQFSTTVSEKRIGFIR